MSQTGTLMGFVHRRRRGAELFLLILALAVGIGAYAAVGLGVEGAVPDRHRRLRRLADRADRRRPHHRAHRRALRRPGAAAARGRPQRPRPRGDPPPRPDLRGAGRTTHTFARQQLIWMTLGVVLFIVTLVLLRDHRMLQRFTYTAGLLGIVLLLLPVPAPHRPRDQRRPDLDQRRRLQLPARRGRQGAAGDRLRRLPRAPPRRAGARRAPGASSSTCRAGATSARSWRCSASR